jgi:hypothetical protein
MHKKIYTDDLDIPVDDVACWERYPKHRWVYDMSRLLDAQNIKWSPFRTDSLLDRSVNMFLHSVENIAYVPSWIYVTNPIGKQIISEVCIFKGEIKYIRYIDKFTKQLLTEDAGVIELRINAFVSMHFKKFTGVITAETIGSDIYSVLLRPSPELALVANAIVLKHIKKVYKKNNATHISGLIDQQLHEMLVS